MTKLKQPLLSLGAQGSVAGLITVQRRQRSHFARQTPFPTDPYTLPQAYQRWLYEDYAYLWRQQSDATKQQYTTAAYRFHLTGFQYWMKYHLKNLPDILGGWKLDEKTGIIARDFSLYQSHGTIVGATPTDGLIDGAQFFTLNDYVRITCPQLNITSEDFSATAIIQPLSYANNPFIFCRGRVNIDGWLLHITTTGRLRLHTYTPGVDRWSGTSKFSIMPGNTYSIGFSRSGASVSMYLNGIDDTNEVGVHIDPVSNTRFGYIGIYDNLVTNAFDGWIDHFVTFNRCLDPSEHKRHAERRYPV